MRRDQEGGGARGKEDAGGRLNCLHKKLKGTVRFQNFHKFQQIFFTTVTMKFEYNILKPNKTHELTTDLNKPNPLEMYFLYLLIFVYFCFLFNPFKFNSK